MKWERIIDNKDDITEILRVPNGWLVCRQIKNMLEMQFISDPKHEWQWSANKSIQECIDKSKNVGKNL